MGESQEVFRINLFWRNVGGLKHVAEGFRRHEVYFAQDGNFLFLCFFFYLLSFIFFLFSFSFLFLFINFLFFFPKKQRNLVLFQHDSNRGEIQEHVDKGRRIKKDGRKKPSLLSSLWLFFIH